MKSDAYTHKQICVGFEVDGYLKEKQPNIVGLVETKSSDQLTIPMIGKGKYNAWARHRKDKKRGW